MSADEHDNKDSKNQDLPDSGHHLSEEEVERALASFEAEFNEGQDQADQSAELSGSGLNAETGMVFLPAPS